MYANALKHFQGQGVQTDPLIDDPSDRRTGLTLLIRPPEAVCHKISGIIEDFRALLPDQYFYPESDMHITIMSIISCYPEFNTQDFQADPYIELTKECLEGIPPIKINLKGITASPAGLVIQGFPMDRHLNKLRDVLRQRFRASELEESIDRRYTIRTAHLTFMRFRKPLRETDTFIQLLNNHRNTSIGEFTVDNMQLTINDWYQKEAKTTLIHRFKQGR
ncbi:mutarotase [Robertkochia solimangrovi]|nr:mutarotase [Robertkochia solimangrovi]